MKTAVTRPTSLPGTNERGEAWSGDKIILVSEDSWLLGFSEELSASKSWPRMRACLKSPLAECGRPRPQRCSTSNGFLFLQHLLQFHVAAPGDGRTPSKSNSAPKQVFRQPLRKGGRIHLLIFGGGQNPMLTPPSTGKTTPVTNLPAGEHK